MKRIVCLLIAFLMIVTALVACSDAPAKKDHGNNGNNDNPTGDVDDKYNIPDDLPEKSFGNREFKIGYRFNDSGNGATNFGETFYEAERPGDIVGNAVYDSIAAVEQRFGVSVIAEDVSNGATEEGYTSAVKQAIGTGDKTYQLYQMHDTLSASASLDGYFLNLHDLDHIDFTKPWWPTVGVEAMTVQGKLYLGSSSMAYSGLSAERVLFFNKEMLTTNGFEAPYEDVLNGDWYLENLLEITQEFYVDTNENNTKDEEDIYGLLAGPQFYVILEGFGIQTVKTVDGNLTLNANTDDMIQIVGDFYDVFVKNDGGYLPAKENNEIGMFAAQKSLFVIGELSDMISTYRAADLEYGILPIPKLNDRQKDYYAAYTDRFFVVPNTCDDTDFVGFMLEALSAQGYRTIYPAYFETALKGRYSHDDETKEILDRLQEHRVMSFAYTYTSSKCFARTLYQLISQKGSKDFATYYGENEIPAGEKLIEIQGKFNTLK